MCHDLWGEGSERVRVRLALNALHTHPCARTRSAVSGKIKWATARSAAPRPASPGLRRSSRHAHLLSSLCGGGQRELGTWQWRGVQGWGMYLLKSCSRAKRILTWLGSMRPMLEKAAALVLDLGTSTSSGHRKKGRPQPCERRHGRHTAGVGTYEGQGGEETRPWTWQWCKQA